MASNVEICSQALLRLGDDPISSFLDGSSGPLCGNLFPNIKKRVLIFYPWRFNTKKSQLLDRTLIEPPTEYKFAYELPPDSLTALILTAWDAPFNQGRSSPFTDFDIFEGKFLTSAEQVFIDYQVDKDSEVFPPHVEELTILAMKAVLSLPITERQAVADASQAEAWGLPQERGRGGYARIAVNIDGKGRPASSIRNFSLVSVRHGGV